MKWSLYVFLLFTSVLHAVDDLNHDFQLWTMVAYKQKLSKHFGFELEGSNRRDKHATRSYYNDIQFNAIWYHCSWKIAPGFRQVFVKNNRLHWKADPIPLIDITKDWSWKRLDISDRSRIEYKCREYEWLYRNRLGIQSAQYFTRLKIAPYLSDEIFLSRFRRLVENRFQIGFAFKCGLDIAYMYRSKEALNGWIQQNVLALSWNEEF